MAGDLRIDVQEGLADVAREGEVALPVTGIVVIVEDPADAARLVAVRQEEVVVAPGLVARMPGRVVPVARGLQGGVEAAGVVGLLAPLYTLSLHGDRKSVV